MPEQRMGGSGIVAEKGMEKAEWKTEILKSAMFLTLLIGPQDPQSPWK